MTLEPASVPPEVERLTAIIERALALVTAKEVRAERILASHTEAVEAVETARRLLEELAGPREAMRLAHALAPREP